MTPLVLTGTGREPRGSAHGNDSNPGPAGGPGLYTGARLRLPPLADRVLDVVRVDNRGLVSGGVPQSGGGQPIHDPRNPVAVLEEELGGRRAEYRPVDARHATVMGQIRPELVPV